MLSRIHAADAGTVPLNLTGDGANGLVDARQLPTLNQLAVALLSLLLLVIGMSALKARRS